MLLSKAHWCHCCRRLSTLRQPRLPPGAPPTLMSRCSSWAECMNLSERKIWYMMYCLCTSSRMLARMTACRSVSMYSNTR